MPATSVYPRLVEPRLEEALDDTPVVLIHGPRQCGKTTLARELGAKRGYAYFSFDDEVAARAAAADPLGFVGELPRRTILDEVQRVPEIFAALKVVVDRHRVSGRFLLTGSSNVLLLSRLSDSLAGRMGILRLHPFSQDELRGHRSTFLDALFSARFPPRQSPRLRDDLLERVVAGGFPAALDRRGTRRRSAWYRDYIETLVQRDVRELARIRALDEIPRLLELAAGQTARLFNLSQLAGPFQVSRPTIHDYVALLERVFLLERLAPWHANHMRRLIKTPKLHITDTGVACALLGLDAGALARDRAALGALLETFVLQELRRQASGHETDIRFSHFRDKDGAEVDIVLERSGGAVSGVEVKAGATVRASDYRGLRKLSAAVGDRFAAGVVLYDGEIAASFGDGMAAVPIRQMWERAPSDLVAGQRGDGG